jgi:hypothetical protein
VRWAEGPRSEARTSGPSPIRVQGGLDDGDWPTSSAAPIAQDELRRRAFGLDFVGVSETKPTPGLAGVVGDELVDDDGAAFGDSPSRAITDDTPGS